MFSFELAKELQRTQKVFHRFEKVIMATVILANAEERYGAQIIWGQRHHILINFKGAKILVQVCNFCGQHYRSLHIASEFIAWRFKCKTDITKSSLELKLLASKFSCPLLSPPPSVSSSSPHRGSSHPPPPIFSPASRRAPIHRSRTRNCCCIQRCTPRCPLLLP